MIAIIDYGMGNLASVQNAFLKVGYPTLITARPEDILAADKVVLPGVGAFGDAIHNLRQRGMDETIRQIVERQTPLLGICLGMQLLFSQSEENGLHLGLDIIPGRVQRFDLPADFKVPQIGWNSIVINPASRLLAGIPSDSYFYFVHSYYVVPDDSAVVAARTDYGIDFVSAIERGALMATQFHPEKSSRLGLRILKNFGELKL
ncbi:MAG: imidazole glycerol phosphate synthase subunit HisH [Syntrophomonas sp.]|nr:imidazole glycerol phosphate synthase subunit HisH [Syntrophomonas sp.]